MSARRLGTRGSDSLERISCGVAGQTSGYETVGGTCVRSSASYKIECRQIFTGAQTYPLIYPQTHLRWPAEDQLIRQLKLLDARSAGRIRSRERSLLIYRSSTKVELIVNLKTAKALGVTMPLAPLGRADEVIE